MEPEHLVFLWDVRTAQWEPMILDGKQVTVASEIIPAMFELAGSQEIDPCVFEGDSRVYIMGLTRYEPATVFNRRSATITTDDAWSRIFD